MIGRFKQWWRPHHYHVEFFRGAFGMASYHDDQRYSNLRDAKARLSELGGMEPEEIKRALGVDFVPSFLRVLCTISARPYRRVLNYFDVPLIHFTLFGRWFHF